MKKHSGKVRDIYEISDDKLVIVTSDRISAFDIVLSKAVPNKGKLLNAISLFWFDYTKDIIPNHLISSDTADMPEFFQTPQFDGRTVMVKKLKILPFECIVRAYMFGSMWQAYKDTGEFVGNKIDGDYKLAEKLSSPMFTVSTKAHEGHDENIPFERMENELGPEMAGKIRDISLKLFDTCYKYAYDKGLIIADTKLEFGLDSDGNLILADEIFTPDSSRYWSLSEYKTGISPKSFDKQLLRDWLTDNKKNGEMCFDEVPDEVLTKTAEIYEKCSKLLTE